MMTTKYNALPKAYDGPARIWLQWEDFEDEDIGVTWSREKINDSDVEYITVGLFEAMQRGYESQLAALRERVAALEAALMPFARVADYWDETPGPKSMDEFVPLTKAPYERARSLFKATAEGGER